MPSASGGAEWRFCGADGILNTISVDGVAINEFQQSGGIFNAISEGVLAEDTSFIGAGGIFNVIHERRQQKVWRQFSYHLRAAVVGRTSFSGAGGILNAISELRQQ